MSNLLFDGNWEDFEYSIRLKEEKRSFANVAFVVNDLYIYKTSHLSRIILDNTVNARLLISSGIITYTLCALSSHCADTRSAARFILYEFRSHLESSSLADTIQVTYLVWFYEGSCPHMDTGAGKPDTFSEEVVCPLGCV